MNTLNVLNQGHDAIVKAISGSINTEWHASDVNGEASAKDILAQMVAFEYVLVEILGSFLDNCPTPTLDALLAGYDVFLERAVPHQTKPLGALWAEYELAHARTITLLAQIPPEMRRQKGTLPWYGIEFALDDFIAYTFFGTKRKWSAQIRALRNNEAQHRAYAVA